VETIYGSSNWKLTIRREKDHVVILRAVTCDARAQLPEELFGLPVTVLGDHALSPTAKPVSGEEVRIQWGQEGEWDNRNLLDLTLPAALTDVQNYALYGCRSLHTLRLSDGIKRWGGGCLMNCRALKTLHLTRVGEKQGETLAFLCGELQDELDVTIYGTDGSVTRLLFPEYMEEFEENIPHHQFDYRIQGGGFPYHHTFPGKQLSLRAYDDLWEKYRGTQTEPDAAMRLAYYRLRWPAELGDAAEAQYTAYLRQNGEAVLLWQLSQRDGAGFSLLLQKLEPEEAILHRACEHARQESNTEALALLLERQRKAAPRGFDMEFDL